MDPIKFKGDATVRGEAVPKDQSSSVSAGTPQIEGAPAMASLGNDISSKVEKKMLELNAKRNNPGDSDFNEKIELAKLIDIKDLRQLASKGLLSKRGVKEDSAEENDIAKELDKIDRETKTEQNPVGQKPVIQGEKMDKNVKSKAIDGLADALISIAAKEIKRKAQVINEPVNPAAVVAPASQTPVEQPAKIVQQETITSDAETKKVGQYQPDPVVPPAKQQGIQEPEAKPQTENVTPKEEAEKAGSEKKAQSAVPNAKATNPPPKQTSVEQPTTEVQQETITTDAETKKVGVKDVPPISLKVTKIKEDVKPAAVTQPAKDTQGATITETSAVPDSNLPGANSVTNPANVMQNTTICARFNPAKRKLESSWTVYGGKKPLFTVSLRQAFGEDKNAIKNWKTFVSGEYGSELERKCKKEGIVKTLRKYFGNGKYATIHKAQVAGEEGANENMNVAPEIEEEISQTSTPERSKILDLLPDVVALFAAFDESFDAEAFGKDLKSISDDEQALGDLVGKIKAKIDTVQEKKSEETDKVEDKENEGVEMISAALKPIIAISNPFSSAFLSYMSKMIGGSDYVSKLKSYMSAIKGQLKESNKRVASIDADNKKTAEKDALRTKARKSIILARNMIKKGLVAPQDEDAKIKELMEYEDKALNEIAKETANIKTSKVGGRKLLARIPSMSQDGDGLREVPTKKEVEGAQLWDTPKKVDEKNAVDYSKRGKK